MDDAYPAARSAWPQVEVAREVFEAWVAERRPKDGEALHFDELYLTCACARGDSTAIAVFEQRYFGAIAAAVGRFPVGVDDVKSELRERLFVGVASGRPKICEYSGRGGLDRWVRAAAVRVALNASRSRPHHGHVTLSDDDFLVGPDAALQHLKDTYRAEFKRAFSDALSKLEPELQTWLRMYYLDELTLLELAKLFEVSEPTASRRVTKAREQVLEVTRTLLQERLKVDGDELDSIMRVIQSRLSITLGSPAR